MQTLGLQMLAPQNNGQTATGDLINQSKQISNLGMIADSLKDGLEEILKLMAEFKGLKSADHCSVIINKDYTMRLSAADMTTVLAMVNAGIITKAMAIKEAQKRQIISESIDPDVELEKVAEEMEQDDSLGLMGYNSAVEIDEGELNKSNSSTAVSQMMDSLKNMETA